MTSELDVELEQYEEVVGDLNFSTPVESRSASPYQRSALTFHEPIQQVKTISPCATTYPWPHPVDSHALIPQVPWIPGNCYRFQATDVTGTGHITSSPSTSDRTRGSSARKATLWQLWQHSCEVRTLRTLFLA